MKRHIEKEQRERDQITAAIAQWQQSAKRAVINRMMAVCCFCVNHTPVSNCETHI
jgi:hypothetical protein